MRATVLMPLWTIPLGICCCSQLAAAEANYRLDFDGSWSATTHPGGFPGSSAHFTRLVGGTHNGAVTFWEPGALASPGIERVAEVGSTSMLQSEVQIAIDAGTAKSTLLGASLFSLPNSTSFTFSVDASHPLVSLASMVAPSPDWFVGVSNLSLREQGQWRGQVEVELAAYDAGTEQGSQFSLSNPASSPQEVIRKLVTGPLAGLPPLGTLTFTVLPNELAGDFNLDGQIDAADGQVWQFGYGNFQDGSAQVVDGDANQNGRVNGSDFLHWQQNHGESLAESTAAVSIPEPQPLMLLSVGLAVTLGYRPHSCNFAR
jgi:hypothetical protein